MDRVAALLGALGCDLDPTAARVRGEDPILPCRYPLGRSAASVMAAVGLAAARLGERRELPGQTVDVDVRHAAAILRGFLDQRLDGETLDPDPTGRLPLVGLHRTRDGGWLQTYGLFEGLSARLLDVLGCEPTRAGVARAVAGWDGGALEATLHAAGAPAALVRTADQWDAHRQGRALAGVPVVSVEQIGLAPVPSTPEPAERPLHGLRVLDVTRILAGPVAGRTLAEHGADVLALVAPGLPTVRRAAIDTAIGKRSAALDVRTPAGRRRFDALVTGADVVVSNARPGALARHGLDPSALARLRPGIVCAQTDAFGHPGPWADRVGFEPIAQCATGWADEHRDDAGRPSIVAALPSDYLTGYLSALGILLALDRRAERGGSWLVRTSLCRTAVWLRDEPGRVDPATAPGIDHDATADLRLDVVSGWGRVTPLAPAVQMSVTPARWTLAPHPPGAYAAAWT